MPFTITFVLAVVSFGLTMVSGITGKVPLWVPVLLLAVIFMCAGR